jgi:mRNA interferase MazF
VIAARFSAVVCASIYPRRDGLATQVDVGPDDGLTHESSVHCDALVSVPKTLLSDFVGSLDPERKRSLDRALGIALGLA